MSSSNFCPSYGQNINNIQPMVNYNNYNNYNNHFHHHGPNNNVVENYTYKCVYKVDAKKATGGTFQVCVDSADSQKNADGLRLTTTIVDGADYVKCTNDGTGTDQWYKCFNSIHAYNHDGVLYRNKLLGKDQPFSVKFTGDYNTIVLS